MTTRLNKTGPAVHTLLSSVGNPPTPQPEKREHDLVVLVNADGKFTYASPAVLPMLGYAPEALVGLPVSALVHADDAATLRHMLSDVAASPGTSLKATLRLCAHNGATHRAQATGTNLLQAPGVEAVVLHLRQMPRHKRAARSRGKKRRASEHFVQFYEADAFLLDAMKGFIETGLNSGEAGIVIATKAHLAALEAHLQASGLNLAAEQTQGSYLSMEAGEALDQFMVAGMPEPTRFHALVEPLITQAARRRRRVRVFGEMVALLWSAGNQAAAVRLEELWNSLAQSVPPFSLFCAYPMSSFAGAENEMDFRSICHEHSRVIPAESYTALPGADERLRAISMLQQKADSLQGEITERQAAEQRTFEALTALMSLAHSLAWTQQEAEAPTMRTFAPQLAELARQALGSKQVTLALIDPQTDTLETLAAAGSPANPGPQWQGARLEEVLTPEALSTLQAGGSAVVKLSAYENSLGLVAPLCIEDHLRGLLIFPARAERRVYTPQEHRLAEAVAQLAGFVLEREHWLAERASTQARLLALEETARQMEAFVGIVSHELRTPITALKTSIQLARRRLGKEQDDHASATMQGVSSPTRLLERTETQVRRLTRMIDDLVDLARTRSGKLEMRLSLCDLGQVVNELVESERQVHPTRLISLELPPTPLHVWGDADRLGQVVLNYLTNALKYAPDDRPITVRVEQQGAQARVSVQDQGPGISAEEQQRIWEMFHRVPGIEVQSGSGIGLGLGLHISKTMIERQGGQVGVESAVGQGSTFWFSLPLAAQQVIENSAEMLP